MKNKLPYWIIGGLVTLLLVAIVVQFLFKMGHAPSAEKMAVEVIPTEVAGAQVKQLPIAETESMNKAVDEALGFSDYRYTEYKTARLQFIVYLAYWQGRKRHFMDLGTHAPDNCWVSNGWKMEPKLPKRAFLLNPSVAGPEHPINKTWPAEDRVFQAGGNTIYVGYWHLLAGKPLDYTRYGTGKTTGYLLDNLSRYWDGTAEQYFLRISSDRPLAELEQDPAFQIVLGSLVRNIPLGDSN